MTELIGLAVNKSGKNVPQKELMVAHNAKQTQPALFNQFNIGWTSSQT